MSYECKLSKVSMMFDMSGMVKYCPFSTDWLKDKDGRHFNVATDDLKDIWNSEHHKKLMSLHDRGIKLPSCSQCIISEEAGIKSNRQQYNEELKDVKASDSQPRVLVVKPGNVCNNACRSCNAHTSSMWYKDDYALNDHGKTFKEYLEFFNTHKTAYKDNAVLEKTLEEWEDDIVFWSMYGGEPMLAPLTFKILEQALKSKTIAEKRFMLHTNGMIYKKDLIEKLSHFKHSQFAFSIDAIGEKNDYIRHGSKWKDILINLEKYHTDVKKYPNVDIEIRLTYTPLNIFYYNESFEFFEKMGLPATGYWCDDKPWNDIRYLPQKVKDAVMNKMNAHKSSSRLWKRRINELETWMMTTPKDYATKQNSFLMFNNKLDQIRNENFEKVFPEYSQFFK